MKRENKRKSNEYPTRQNVRNVNKLRISALSKEIVRSLIVQRDNGKKTKNRKRTIVVRGKGLIRRYCVRKIYRSI